MIYGLHIATGGKLLNAPAKAQALGVKTMQIFASNPRSWQPANYSSEEAKNFKARCQKAGLKSTFIHMIYLVNYGTENQNLWQKSTTAIINMMETSDLLGTNGVITHLGSHHGLGFNQALKRLSESLNQALSHSKTSDLILENSAGAGSNMGDSLEELEAIIRIMNKPDRLKVCLDTAHLLASGYEIRTKHGWDSFLEKFDSVIGLDRLAVIHLNDSMVDIDTKRDRHENIGYGFIGEKGFRNILNHPKLQKIPGILEVPGMKNMGPDEANLKKLIALTN